MDTICSSLQNLPPGMKFAFFWGMNGTSDLQIRGLGPVGIRMMVAHLKKHANRKHLLAVKGPDGTHQIVVQPGSSHQAEQELRRLISRPEYLAGVYAGAVQAL